jgi:F-type H+-transporting ATPase subunit gamma
MSNSTASLRRKIGRAGDLQSVVRTMKGLAASSIGQYEESVQALADYARTVELGLSACFHEGPRPPLPAVTVKGRPNAIVGAVVFGSDQGLVGQFNDVVTDFAIKTLAALPGKTHAWAVGDRVRVRLSEAGLPLVGLFPVPGAASGITALVAEILLETESHRDMAELYLIHNRPTSESGYAPVGQRLLPLDERWRRELAQRPWPTKQVPEVMGAGASAVRALIREYLFVSLFRACAESLASENASRLAAMERADKNIDDLLETLHSTFHRVRQRSIDEELFDVVSGFEALTAPR